MSDKIFIDTNLWVYLYAEDPHEKYDTIRQIVDKHFGHIFCSTQILGELYHVLTRKNLLTEDKAKDIISETIAMFPIAPIETSNVQEAIAIHEEYGYSYWDSLVIATAFLHDFPILYSEDMQHNQLIRGKTRIINPLL